VVKSFAMADSEPHSFQVFLGLGSNLGNRLAFLRGGRDMLLTCHEIQLVRTSGVYQSDAVGGPSDNPPFFNACLEISTNLPPRQLLETCHAAEDEFGRTRPERWAPRTLDIDILFYADLVVDEPDLQIPHPRLHQRCFVLTPLQEIAPNLVCPLRKRTITELCTALQCDSEVELLRSNW